MRLSSLKKPHRFILREIRKAREEGQRAPKALVKAIVSRVAEVGVNAFFPTNGSGNNMSRG